MAWPRKKEMYPWSEILAVYAAGEKTVDEIIVTYGCTDAAFYGAVRRHGVALRRPHAPGGWTARQVKIATQLYKDGLSYKAIGKKVDQSWGALRDKMHYDGVTRDPASRYRNIIAARHYRDGWTDAERDLFTVLYRMKARLEDIAVVMGRTRTAVAHAPSRFNLSRKRISTGWPSLAECRAVADAHAAGPIISALKAAGCVVKPLRLGAWEVDGEDLNLAQVRGRLEYITKRRAA